MDLNIVPGSWGVSIRWSTALKIKSFALSQNSCGYDSKICVNEIEISESNLIPVQKKRRYGKGGGG